MDGDLDVIWLAVSVLEKPELEYVLAAMLRAELRDIRNSKASKHQNGEA
ncbi:hypothetical protein FHT72_003484 [Rhizobium sp. BK077]|nr:MULTISPECIES: hypothetical protein [Rhizobium]MBB3299737.1 hypothetical protein [Rhizobium sp. BK112]MBB3368995.1 hypothetical protein [Rhizobium sp. BK077]MBB4179627.1 hypothetical protein [Rhizobium sp. BK109]